MKRKIFIFRIICWSLGLLVGAVSAAAGEVLVSSSFRYDNARDSGSPRTIGDEYTIPFGIAYQGQHFSLSLETAYSDAYVKTGDNADSHLSGFTDMLLSGTYTYIFSAQQLALTLGVDLSLPTGKEHLTSEQVQAEWGQSNDLFEVDNFGEGLNIGVSLGLMRQFRQNVVLALQGAYIFNGEFDPTADIENDHLDPGDQILIMGLCDWKTSSWLKINTYATYTHFGIDTTDGKESFRQGPQIVLGNNFMATRKPFALFLGLQGTIPTKNEVFIDKALKKEPEKSNGVSIFGLLALTYTYSPTLDLRLQGDIRYYGESDLKDSETGFPFTGERVRYAIGPGWNYRMSKHLTSIGLIKLFTMDQARDVFVKEATSYQGINIDIGFRYVL